MAVDRALLHRFRALRELGPRDLASLARVVEFARYRRGSQLCREGDEDDRCFFLVSGTIGVTKTLPDGRRLLLAELPEGIVFGQSGLVPGQRRTAEVRAVTEVEVLELRLLPLQFGLRNRRPWALKLQEMAAVSLVRQLRGALAHLEALAAGERIAEVRGGEDEGRRGGRGGAPGRRELDPKVERPAVKPLAKPIGQDLSADEASMADLMNLLAETEATLGDLSGDHIRVVVDDAQKRRGDRKK
jgi:CRP-like cAMP-binding protein